MGESEVSSDYILHPNTDVETCQTYGRRNGGVEQVAGVACNHPGVVRIFLPVHHRHGHRQFFLIKTHQQRGTKKETETRIYLPEIPETADLTGET